SCSMEGAVIVSTTTRDEVSLWPHTCHASGISMASFLTYDKLLYAMDWLSAKPLMGGHVIGPWHTALMLTDTGSRRYQPFAFTVLAERYLVTVCVLRFFSLHQVSSWSHPGS